MTPATMRAAVLRAAGGPVVVEEVATPAPGPGEGTDTVRDTTAPSPARAGAAPPTPAAGTRDLAAEARAHYDRAIAAQRAGDWARYGDEIRALGEILQQMRR